MSLTPRKIYSVYFSPTGSSRLAAHSVAYTLKRELNADIEDIDLAPPGPHAAFNTVLPMPIRWS